MIILYFLHRKTDNAHILDINVVINWQLSRQGIRWPVSLDRVAGSGVDSSRSSISLKLSSDKLLVFKWSQAQVYFFKIQVKYAVFMCSTIKNFDFKLTSDAKILCSPLSRVGLALRPIFILWLVKIWQVSWCGKFMQHLESCLLSQLRLSEFCVNLWCF